ncbi:MAG: GNAT family N-acetyltransferase [Bacteroidetes bacterium]|nr:GNAT family N-acetyltransferase [Bacteroidota bacterium]MBU1717825.1 GNAT family N-acetyltransferase [Bacteroidota bacterium]
MEITKVSFRTGVKPEDMEHVREIVTSSGFFYPVEIDVAVELVEERLKQGEASGYEFIFLEVEGITVAYSCYGLISLTKSSYDLYWIATHENQRGNGLGRILLAETERDIAARGGTAIYAETSSRGQYLPTRMFYEKNNYTLKARFEDYYDQGDDLVFYVKKV